MESYEFLLVFSIASVAMLVLAGSIVIFVVFYQKRMIQEQLKRQSLEFDYQQRMMQAELQSQESERRKLAADLHDSIGGMLSTIRVGLTTMGKLLPEPASIDETKKMLDDTITSVRRISRDLMPSTLEKFGLVHAVKELCERFQGTSKIRIQFVEQGEVTSMEPQRQLMIFRVVQELLNNAVKHAQATQIIVSIAVDDRVHVFVEDNGIGFDVEELKYDKQGSKGLGLFNIENRARLLNGILEFEKGRTKGSKTTLILSRVHEKAN
jgi:two-component system, NarL family, sensor kinase